MSDEIKSGKQILDEYFQEIKSMLNVDENVVNCIIDLYETGKLSDKNLSNALLELREKPANE
jgi:predicted RNA-binding protein with RPS1 domain